MRRVMLSKFTPDVRQAAINAAVEVDHDVVTLREGDYLRLRAAGFRPGDAVAATTKVLGFKPCGGCKDRQQKMNDAWRRTLAKE